MGKVVRLYASNCKKVTKITETICFNKEFYRINFLNMWNELYFALCIFAIYLVSNENNKYIFP